MGGVRADAEDGVQETWLRAARSLAAFEGRSAIPTWLVGIAINCARERLRGRPQPSSPVDVLATLPAALTPAAIAVDLDRAIAALPERLRLVLLLHDVEGWTHAEIAAHLD